MTTFWLDWLKTPMAAPETAGLRTMRLAILYLAIILAVMIAALSPLRAAVGVAAGGIVCGVMLALGLLVPVYVWRKNRADEEHFAAVCREGGADAERRARLGLDVDAVCFDVGIDFSDDTRTGLIDDLSRGGVVPGKEARGELRPVLRRLSQDAQ